MSGLSEEQLERLATLINQFWSSGDESLILEIFSLYDLNGNGRVDLREIDIKDDCLRREARSVISEGDGDGTVDQDNFIILMKSARSHRKR